QKEARRVGVSENPLPVHLHERPVRRADDRPELVVPEPYAGEFPEPEETAEGNEGPERRQHEGAKRRGDLQLEPLEAAARPAGSGAAAPCSAAARGRILGGRRHKALGGACRSTALASIGTADGRQLVKW